MQNKVLIGTIALLSLIVIVVLLLGRDGTEPTSPTDIIPNHRGGDFLPSEANLLPVDEEGNLIEDNATTTASSTDEVLEEAVTETIVDYTSFGFNPKEVTILEGEMVTWTNNSPSPMWVASAFHPTHTIYPGRSEEDCLGSTFDACEGIEPGESWSFSFDEVGSWDYHDHNSPSRTGTVIVE